MWDMVHQLLLTHLNILDSKYLVNEFKIVNSLILIYNDVPLFWLELVMHLASQMSIKSHYSHPMLAIVNTHNMEM